MQINNLVAVGTGVGIAIAASTTTWMLMRASRNAAVAPPPKYRRVDITAFKRSMTERYKHVDLVKVDDETKATLIKNIHTNIDKDIHNLFPEVEHDDLMSHNEMLLAKYS